MILFEVTTNIVPSGIGGSYCELLLFDFKFKFGCLSNVNILRNTKLRIKREIKKSGLLLLLTPNLSLSMLLSKFIVLLKKLGE